METSKQCDRERRRTKLKSRTSWAKVLIDPKTVTFLVVVGKIATKIMWLLYLIVKALRE